MTNNKNNLIHNVSVRSRGEPFVTDQKLEFQAQQQTRQESDENPVKLKNVTKGKLLAAVLCCYGKLDHPVTHHVLWME